MSLAIRRRTWLQGAAISLFSGVALAFAAEADNTVKPKIKALIVDGQNNHNWQETTPVLKKLLENSGRFVVDVATSPAPGGDMSQFKPNFAAYDVVIINYAGDSWSPNTKTAFEKYVAEGGRVVIFHAANNAFADWPEYNQICALGGWGGRNEKSGPYLYLNDAGEEVRDITPGPGGNHGPQWAYPIDVRLPEHPIMKGLPSVIQHVPDELYEKLRGPAENVTILATAYADPQHGGSGHHEPQLMLIDYKKGKVFHVMYGHAGVQCSSPSFYVPFLRGTEWIATERVTIPADYISPQ